MLGFMIYGFILSIVVVWINWPDSPTLRAIYWPLFRNQALVDILVLKDKNYLIYWEMYTEIKKSKEIFIGFGWDAFCEWKEEAIRDKWIKGKYLKAV